MKSDHHKAGSSNHLSITPKAMLLGGSLDYTFPQFISTFGKSITTATLLVSIGKALTDHYFVILMTIIAVIVGTLSYIDFTRQQPQVERGYFQNRIYTVFEKLIEEKEVDSALYSIVNQQAKLLTSATPKNQAVRNLGRNSGSNPNLSSLESPKFGGKQNKKRAKETQQGDTLTP